MRPCLPTATATFGRALPRASIAGNVVAVQRQHVRRSHVGSAVLYVPPSTNLSLLPFAPVSNPSRRQPTALKKAGSIEVQGPLGTVLVPLQDYVELRWEDDDKKAPSPSAQEPRRLQLVVQDAKEKAQRSTWGLTRALLANALEGVEEGHSVVIRLVGVGYRAVVEADPFPRPDKLDEALSSAAASANNFESVEQREYYTRLLKELKEKEKAQEPKRLSLRLGYSHPIYMPVPRGLTCLTPAPTRIVVKGVDKEAVGLFASKIRSWRKPEPYKGKGVFVGDETIKLRTAKNK
ncbi:ribosomal protein L6 [Acaromyces ingoldii]|uniref:Ribosomal protein L6 n=1 Tax=Acaromyces ingoldii TaxID=215250 RepID=A0A316YM10_9BASI|nr:ribosomal protein L6 [Acaromyces ingoldii]PWN90289.1 ribosomal protein L6 [Acaromyces ingoldii]